MKICFIDLLFNWQPRGGADVDVYNVLKCLAQKNYDVLLLSLTSSTQNRGVFEPEQLPFPAKKIAIEYSDRNFINILKDFLINSVSTYNPDLIIIGDCFFLKPYITLFFENMSRPIIWRQYAYELLCQKDILKFLNNKPCPLDYLSTQDICRKCGLYHQKNKLTRLEINAWLEEYFAAKAYKSSYATVLMNALKRVQKIIVYSEAMANVWKNYHSNIVIIPGGVDIELFKSSDTTNNNLKKIFLSGRAEDPAKGFDVLYKACKKLRQSYDNFELICTSGWLAGYPNWVKFTGWLDYCELPQKYAEIDICVVPSVWEEPFGMVALEAMSTGKPVIASNVGGLKTTVLHGKTGFLFTPNNEDTLAKYLKQLLTDDTLRKEVGIEARKHAINNYSWEKVVSNYYERELLSGK